MDPARTPQSAGQHAHGGRCVAQRGRQRGGTNTPNCRGRRAPDDGGGRL